MLPKRSSFDFPDKVYVNVKTGGLTGWFKSLFVEEQPQQKLYESSIVRKLGTLLAVDNSVVVSQEEALCKALFDALRDYDKLDKGDRFAADIYLLKGVTNLRPY